MESDILVEAFRIAPTMHSLKYVRFIADGDSSTHAELTAKVPYGRYIEKIECANHACKCLKKRLYMKQKENPECRRLLSGLKIKKMCDFARNAIARTTKEGKGVKDLVNELKAIPLHFFYGDHRQCPECCKMAGKIVEFSEEGAPSNIFLSHVYSAFDTLTRRARFLIGNSTSNLAEYFMSIVAKLIGGKNIMVTKRARYTTRVTAAGIKYSKGHSARLHIFRRSLGSTPSRLLKRLAEQRARRAINKQTWKAKRRLFGKPFTKKVSKPDKNYGPNACVPDLDLDSLEDAKSDFLNRVQCTDLEIHEIEEAIRLQINCIDNRWLEYRKNRITASVAGIICKRRTKTVAPLVRQLLYPKNRQTKAMEHGQMYEQIAISAFEKKMDCKVHPSGLFVHIKYGYFAASPDGIATFLSGDTAVLEVKCPFSAKNLNIEEWRLSQKNICLENKNNGTLQLKRSHNYFYQIQMQLECCNIDSGYFVILFCKGDPFIEKINRDKEFWQKKMLPKLQKFYLEAILPEIVDARLPRNMEIREPFL